MPFATIAGRTYGVLKDGATEAQPDKVGQRRRAFTGRMRSGERVTKRHFTLPLAPILESAYQLLMTDTENSQEVVCSGDFTNGAAFVCVVDITGAAYYRPVASGPLYRLVTLDVLVT